MHADFDPASLAIEVRATRAIEEGEEILRAYTPGLQLAPTAERLAALKRVYRFQCTCPRCARPAASDATLQRILRDAPDPEVQGLKYLTGAVAIGADHEAMLRHSLECLDVIEGEGLEGCHEYGSHLSVVWPALLVLKRQEESRHYFELSCAWTEANGGKVTSGGEEGDAAD